MVHAVVGALRSRVSRAEGNEHGAVAVLVAVLAVVLMASAAFALDLGNARGLKRKAQTAADAAALAGARVIQAGGDPVAVATDYANKNGFGNATVNRPPSSGGHSGDNNCIEVISNGTVDTVFAKVIGINTVNVKARAVACGTSGGGGGGGYAIFANSTTCDKTIDWSGSSTNVDGGVHSNNEILIGGSNNDVDGPTTYRDSFDNGGGGNSFTPLPQQDSTVKALPVNFAIADYAPGGSKASLAQAQGLYHNAGNNKIDSGWLEGNTDYDNGVLEPGLYYTTKDIDLSASDLTVSATGVTFVTSNGVISVSGSDHHLRPWDTAGLLVFSNHQKSGGICDGIGIKFSGSNHDWTGIVFAPRSTIEMSGSSNSTLNGSLIGNTVKLNGSDLGIIYEDSFGGGGGAGTIKLVE